MTEERDLLNHQSVSHRAALLQAAHAEVGATFAIGQASGQPRESGPAWAPWRRAAARLQSAMRIMYPDPLWGEIKAQLRNGWPTAREAALVFLEADPWCVRSGYEKAELMKALSHVDLGYKDRERVRRIVLHVLEQPPRREFRHLVGLAISVWDPALDEALEQLARTGSDQARRGVVRLRQFLANRLHEASLRAESPLRRTSFDQSG